MAFVIPDHLNGALDLGIAAGVDTISDQTAFLHFPAGILATEAAVRHAVCRLVIPPGWSDLVKSLYVRSAVYVISNGLVGAHSNATVNSLVAAVSDDAAITAILDTEVDGTRVATLVWATKVTYWMVNHHVGQDANKIAGYVGKVINAWELSGEAGIRDALWRVGHWVDTRYAMVELGIANIQGGYARRNLVRMSDDMALRVRSNPAGTAKLFTYYEIYKLAVRSVFSLFITVATPRVDIEESVALVEANPVRYHMGSLFLSGEAKLDAAGFTEAELADLAAFIHVVQPNGSLAKAGVIISKADLASLESYVNMTNLKIAMAKGVNMKVALNLAAKRGVGTGGLAVTSGLITAQDLQDAKDEVEAAEVPAQV
jgi:hypothetical protein